VRRSGPGLSGHSGASRGRLRDARVLCGRLLFMVKEESYRDLDVVEDGADLELSSEALDVVPKRGELDVGSTFQSGQ